MTYKELADEVLNHGFDPTRYRPRVKQWLNEALHRIARSLSNTPAAYDFNTAAGTATYALPAAALRVRSLRIPGDNFDLEATDLIDLDQAPTGRGKPYGYALDAGQITLYPTPDAVYALEARYFANATSMTSDTDVPVLSEDYHDLLVSYALSKAYKAEDDAEMAQFHYGEYTRELNLAKADLLQPQRDRVRQVPGMFAGGPQSPTFARP